MHNDSLPMAGTQCLSFMSLLCHFPLLVIVVVVLGCIPRPKGRRDAILACLLSSKRLHTEVVHPSIKPPYRGFIAGSGRKRKHHGVNWCIDML